MKWLIIYLCVSCIASVIYILCGLARTKRNKKTNLNVK